MVSDIVLGHLLTQKLIRLPSSWIVKVFYLVLVLLRQKDVLYGERIVLKLKGDVLSVPLNCGAAESELKLAEVAQIAGDVSSIVGQFIEVVGAGNEETAVFVLSIVEELRSAGCCPVKAIVDQQANGVVRVHQSISLFPFVLENHRLGHMNFVDHAALNFFMYDCWLGLTLRLRGLQAFLRQKAGFSELAIRNCLVKAIKYFTLFIVKEDECLFKGQSQEL